jgi:hypothetical protein
MEQSLTMETKPDATSFPDAKQSVSSGSIAQNLKVGEYHAGHNEDLGPLPQMSRSANWLGFLKKSDALIMIQLKSNYGDETTTEYGQSARLMNHNKAGKR